MLEVSLCIKNVKLDSEFQIISTHLFPMHCINGIKMIKNLTEPLLRRQIPISREPRASQISMFPTPPHKWTPRTAKVCCDDEDRQNPEELHFDNTRLENNKVWIAKTFNLWKKTRTLITEMHFLQILSLSSSGVKTGRGFSP